MLLASRDKEVARPDDLVDPWQPLHAVGQCGDGLRPAEPIDLVDAQLAAGGEHVVVVGPETRWGSDDGKLFHAGHLAGTAVISTVEG